MDGFDLSGLQPLDDSSGGFDVSGLKPVDTSAPEPGLASIVAGGVAKGFSANYKAAKQAAQLASHETPDSAEEAPDETSDYTTAPFDFTSPPTSAADLGHLGKKLVGKTAYGLTEALPEMGGALVGGGLGALAGTAVAPGVGTTAGAIGGTALGAGAVNAAKTLAPFYAEELKRTPADQDGAFNRALERAGTSGAFTGMGFALFEAKPFAGAVKNIALQALGIQPTVAAAGQVAQNAETGKPLGEGVAQAAGEGAVGTAVPLATHAVATRMRGNGEAAPVAASDQPAEPLAEAAAPAEPEAPPPVDPVLAQLNQRKPPPAAPAEPGAAAPESPAPVSDDPVIQALHARKPPPLTATRDDAIGATSSTPVADNIRAFLDATEPAPAPEAAEVKPATGERDKPIAVESADDVARAGERVAPAPTQAQKEAGNYAKGHVTLDGLDITIENPSGSTRSGTGPDGEPWQVEMPAAYGYIKGTEGADGDHVDAYIGPNPKSDHVFVVDQIDPLSGKFDEHKALVGFDSLPDALATYRAGFSDGLGPARAGAVATMSKLEFRAWLDTGDTKKPIGYEELKPAEPMAEAPEGAVVPEPDPSTIHTAPDSILRRAMNRAGIKANRVEYSGLSQNRFAAIKTPEQRGIVDFVDGVLGGGNEMRRMPIAAVSRDEAARIKDATGLDVAGASHIIDTYGIRHALGEHGNPEAEGARGQLALQPEDFALIPEVLRNPDTIKHVGKTKIGRDVIRYTKRFNGEIVYVEEVRNGKNQLALQTVYKRPSRRAIAQGPKHSTSETTSRATAADTEANPSTDGNINPKRARDNPTNGLRRPIGDSDEAIRSGEGEWLAPDIIGEGRGVTYTPEQRALAEEVAKVAARLAPGGRAESFQRIRDAKPGPDGKTDGPLWGGFIPNPREAGHLMAWSFESPDAVGTARHEAIHFLRRTGLLDHDEWATLARAAEQGDWAKKHEIDQRYEGQKLSPDERTEEAIAEEFADWRRGDRTAASAETRGIFQRLEQIRRQVVAAIRRAFGRPPTAKDIFDMIDRGDVGRRGNTRVEPRLGDAVAAQTAWHGSPHDFGAFSLDKIGTGEGAQAYGHGLYFAGKRDVAQHYRDVLSGAGRGVEPRDIAARILEATEGDKERAITELQRRADAPHVTDDEQGRAFRQKMAAAIDVIRSGDGLGRLYKVDLAPQEHEYLDWDKTLSDQSPQVKAALDKLMTETPGLAVDHRMTGEDFYRSLAEAHAPKVEDNGWTMVAGTVNDRAYNGRAASSALNDAGIPGLRYKDGSSRNSRPIADLNGTVSMLEGALRKAPDDTYLRAQLADAREKLAEAEKEITHNYVIFDDKHVRIESKMQRPKERPQSVADRERTEKVNAPLGKPISPRGVAQRIAAHPVIKKLLGSDPVQAAGEKFADLLTDVQMKLAPMATGTDRARAVAKDFANSDRLQRWRWRQLDTMLQKNFTPARRQAMGRALDEQSVMEQTGATKPDQLVPGKGLSTLSTDERAVVKMLNDRAKTAWEGMVKAGIVKGEGLPQYMPRWAVYIGADGTVEHLPKEGAGGSSAMDPLGLNLTTMGPGEREHLTPEETERAIKAKFGSNALLVRDIRALPLAIAREERAIAGKKLIQEVKRIGDLVGEETVASGEKPGFVTIDHPAFKEYRPKFDGDGNPVLDEHGDPVMDKVPLYIAKEFEGPLRAVLTRRAGAIYRGLMALKSGATSLIMYSPLIHNAVEYGRAFPLMPGKMLTLATYRRGYADKQNPEVMKQAIDAGLVPIGGHGARQDITSMTDEPSLEPGRSMTAKVIGGPIGFFNQAAGFAVKRGVDAAGDFWHGTLLWNRIGDLQMGIYSFTRDKLLAKGMDEGSAAKLAAHFANRYAGAIPAESMSDGARKVANVMMFSRSFTLGNLGAMKDMISGLPRDVQAQMRRDVGDLATQAAKSIARRKAIGTLLADIALFYGANAITQSAFDYMKRDKSLPEILHGYADRFGRLMHKTAESPLSALDPFGDLQALTPQADNEPGKEDRVLVGTDAGGTALYMRNPFGKIGEEFKGYITSPIEMFRRKQSTLFRPVLETVNNDKGFGRRVYDPKDSAPSIAGDIVWHFMQSQIPTQLIQGAHDLAMGSGDQTVAALKALGPVAGLTFSRGAPGGPAMGEYWTAKRDSDAKISAAMPGVNALIDSGKTDDARQKLVELGMTPHQAANHIVFHLNPRNAPAKAQAKTFNRIATDEQKERMQRALGQ